jgi:hypothetical protein
MRKASVTITLCAVLLSAGTVYASNAGGLPACQRELTSVQGSLATANAGTAAPGDVLSGKTFSSNAGIGVPGTMVNKGAVTLTPGTTDQTIPAGYHNGLGFCAGDPDLLPGNIKSGINIFNVTGTLACGNAIIDPGEQCDQGNLNGKTCAALGFVGGALACGAGCVFDTSGCTTQRFVDNQDGTVTDHQTGLMWEKKSPAGTGDVHDVNNTYTWSTANPSIPDGTAFTNFLGALNAGTLSDGTTIIGCFAGHCDWRLPTIAELQTILLAPYPCGTNPCIDPVFGPTRSNGLYWSAITGIYSYMAWLVGPGNGLVTYLDKSYTNYVRAVRGGL